MAEIFLFNEKEIKLDKTNFVNQLFSNILHGIFIENAKLSNENQVLRYKITQSFKHK